MIIASVGGAATDYVPPDAKKFCLAATGLAIALSVLIYVLTMRDASRLADRVQMAETAAHQFNFQNHE